MICKFLNYRRNYEDDKEYYCMLTGIPCCPPDSEEEIQKCIRKCTDDREDRR